MMGHGYYGSKLKDQERHEEKFAWLPVRSTFSKQRIWLTKYHIVHILYDNTGRPPIKGWSWPLIYTKHEYLIMLLKKEAK
jgi:hypothetical protein